MIKKKLGWLILIAIPAAFANTPQSLPWVYGPVQNHETIWSIVDQTKSDTVTHQQMAVVLFENNPNAFNNNNINSVQAKSYLKISSLNEFNKYTPTEANLLFKNYINAYPSAIKNSAIKTSNTIPKNTQNIKNKEEINIIETVIDTTEINKITITETSNNEWTLDSNKSLRGNLEIWAAKAGWQLIWNMEHDYGISFNATLQGDFIDAVSTLAEAYAMAPNPVLIRPVFYTQSNVLVVQSGEEL